MDTTMGKIERWMEGHKLTAFFLNRDNFALIYATVCTLWFFPLLGWLMDPVCKVCFIWGAFLVLWDFLTKRRMFRSIYWVLPLLMIVGFGVTILLNIRYSFYMGVKHMVYLGISLLLLYGQDRTRSFESTKKLLYRLNGMIIGVVFVASLISIFMFIFQISFEFPSGEIILRQGFLENRLFGVYTSPNTGALFVVISLAAMLINSLLKNNGKLKPHWFYIVNIVVQTIYFSLTLSNGGFLTYIAFLVLLIIAYIFPNWKQTKGTAKALFSTFLASVLLLGGTIGLMFAVRNGMSYIPPLVEKIWVAEDPENPDAADDEEANKIELERIESGDDTSNGRLVIWSGSLKALRQHPLFGYANMWLSEEDARPFDISSFTEEETEWLFKHVGNLHNAYVQVAVYSGIVGFILFLIFGCLLVKKIGLALIRGKKNTMTYNVLAVLFSIVGAIAANGLVEAHLLYTRQDPYGAIFWIYLGLATVLAEQYWFSEENTCEDGKDGARFALAADTPFQTMNCCNFVLQNTDGSAVKSDLYIYHQFRNSHELSERIKQSGVFCNVYDIEPYKDYPSLIQKFATIYRLFLPQYAIQGACSEKLRLGRKRYHKICISFPTTFTLGLHWAFKSADVYHIEDGLGSYGGNITVDYSSKLYQLINHFMYHGDLDMNPVACYLSAPDFSKNTIGGEVRRLPAMQKGVGLETIEKIFDYRENDLYRDRVVYLAQPLTERPIYHAERDAQIVELLQKVLPDRTVVRLHPRQKDLDVGTLQKDTYGNLWELECIHQITDKNVLISAFSTAQFMPKIMQDKEPSIIFTYRLVFDSLDDPFLKDFAALIEDFKELYRDPSRIYVPETFEELEALFAKLKSEGTDAS